MVPEIYRYNFASGPPTSIFNIYHKHAYITSSIWNQQGTPNWNVPKQLACSSSSWWSWWWWWWWSSSSSSSSLLEKTNSILFNHKKSIWLVHVKPLFIKSQHTEHKIPLLWSVERTSDKVVQLLQPVLNKVRHTNVTITRQWSFHSHLCYMWIYTFIIPA